ncbi:branched-chain amino acid ABC transporter substrate-binding protein [Noviherbaspirillum sp. 17J57-3]|uniref:Branched-chain amino acid ABC transporter substrate-binding protein n=2 Tax=Noviherbaspirillum galbum TaxID=2709383 RepID=A0A6B3SNF2_9BURK|nr:branched-chain amino acid ABC transporter substrate-binding protein [Noviherbaspirillum galbum]
MTSMKLAGFAVAVGFAVAAHAADTVKIAFVDPLSGSMANIGENELATLTYLVNQINDRGGVLGGRKFEIVSFDNKLSPQETLAAMKNVHDRKIPFVIGGNGSSVGGAIIEELDKNNVRNPDNRALYLNFASIDPDFTNSKCSFWHFRFDAHSDMKMQALTNYLKEDSRIKKVYIIGQDYSFGHQVSRAAKEMLKAKRPDIQIVGDDLHPIGKVKDFQPYVTKIRASGADTVITGNWGNDLSLLVKAGKESNLDVKYYTYNAYGPGTATAIGTAGADKVNVVAEWHNNLANPKTEKFYADYRKALPAPKDELYYYRIRYAMDALVAGIEKAKSIDPLKVASAMEDLSWDSDMGRVTLRRDDHQLQMPMVIARMTNAGSPKAKNDVEGSGLGFETKVLLSADQSMLPTSCQMKRPEK